MKISVIICAAGKGERAGFNKNKLLAPLYGAPALYHTLSAVSKIKPFELFITSSPQDMAEISAISAPFGGKVVGGGETRTLSVYYALKHVTGDIVLIHDGARPFTLPEQFLECIECVKEYGSGIVAMPATDTVYIANDNSAAHIPERTAVFAVQTPQGFMTQALKDAYEKAVKSGEAFTDDGSVYSRFCKPARICPVGSAANRKLTFKEDFDNFGAVIPATVGVNVEKTGIGIDVHAFGKPQNFIMLCGVKVPCDTGLVAHSDGDVALHAVMDAILSAAGLKDIGHYFPDDDQKYKGADSSKLLEEVIEIIGKKGLKVSGLSVAIQAEKPRLAPYIDGMVESLARLSGAKASNISVAAGTCEGLGFVGEKRGICAYCAATIIRN